MNNRLYSHLSTEKIYACAIFVEHSHDIFPEYSAKVAYEFSGEYSQINIEYRDIPIGI